MTKRDRDCTFDNVDATTLVEDDLKEVKEAVIKLAAKARSLGLALGISASRLATIRSTFINDLEEMLTEVLHTWLMQAYDVKKHGLPSWRTLVQTIENPAGGSDPALAMEISAHHPVSGNEPQHKWHRRSEGETEPQQVTSEKANFQSILSQKTSGKYAGSEYTFVEAVPQYLCCTCSKCKDKVLPVEPYRVQSQLFCESCIQHVDVNSQDVLDSASKKQIQGLKIMCPNSGKGCVWEGQLGKVEIHQSICRKESISCQFEDIGCKEMMLRDEADEHNGKNKDQHLHYATVTIKEMKKTDTDIRQQMKQLEDEVREKIKELKQKYEGVIQQLKEEISPCPPVIVRMINKWDNSSPLSVYDLFHDHTFVSSVFYSHPQGYKLCIVLKCSKEEVKVKVAAIQQENAPKKWPCKGVAVITVQPEGKDCQWYDIDFIIVKSTGIEHLDEEGYKICSIPETWHEMGAQYSCITLKVEKIQLY